MALCASVMAGLYASPVMADTPQVDEIYSSGKSSVQANADGTIDFNVFTTQGDGTQNVARIASLDANGFSIHNGSGNFPVFYVGRDNGDFMAAGGDFRVDANGNVTANGYLQLKDANDQYQKLTADKLATVNTVITDEGAVKSLGDVISTDGTNTYSLNAVGANTAGIRRTNNGTNNVTIIEENLKVYDDGTIVAANENFKVNKDGNVFANAVNIADGTVVISEDGINAYDNKFTVNPDGGITAVGGANLAEGMFTASVGGVTMANGNVQVDTEGNIVLKDGLTVDGVDVSELAEKLGIKTQILKAGIYKEAGTFMRPWNKQEEEMLRNLINEQYWLFVKEVAEARKLDIKKEKDFAQGRILSANNALKLGLIDSVGGIYEAQNTLFELAKIEEPMWLKKDKMDLYLERIIGENVSLGIQRAIYGLYVEILKGN